MKQHLAAAALAAVLAGCSSTPITEGAPVEDRGAPPPPPAPTTTAPVTTPGLTQAEIDKQRMEADRKLLTDPASPLSKRSVFFDYDSDRIRDEFRPLVEAHARFLRDRPYQRMLVQGNSDERGSREYNLALGQRRADAVKRALVTLGANEKQVEATSLGEEKLRCTEQTESCHAQNRRADMLYGYEL
jgi:peptidoglycan-associated lipoprotein